MSKRLDMDRIAKALGAERGGKVVAAGGYLGARQLLADVEDRFQAPAGGGRGTDPRWTERRLLPLSRRTLDRLEKIAAQVREHEGRYLEPMQVAALLLEKATEQLNLLDETKVVVRPRRYAKV